MSTALKAKPSPTVVTDFYKYIMYTQDSGK